MIHGGNIRQYQELSGKKEILDFSANINPLGFPPFTRPFLNSKISDIIHYPDPEYLKLKESIANFYGIEKNRITLGNGTSETLMVLPRALGVNKAFLFVPGFYQYERSLKAAGAVVTKIPLEENFHFNLQLLDKKLENIKGEAVYLGHPHNPTGICLDLDVLNNLLNKYPQVIFIIDEAFIEFTTSESTINWNLKNLIVLRSLTKILAIPGLRLGFCVADEKYSKKIEEQLPYWNVNHFASSISQEFFENDPQHFLKETVETISSLRNFLINGLSKFPLKIHESEANFLLIECFNDDAQKISETLLKKHGIALRKTDSFENLNESRFLRLAVRPKEEIELLLNALGDYFNKRTKKKNKTPALMLQGTTSNAGKSILTTAICRILYQDGLKVMPFKSQNMSLNSFVTKDGGEIGRAQAVQAMACKQDASILMNPILLKPNSDIGSQVIINGKPLSHMDFKDYFQFKPTAFIEVKKAYDEISDCADVMVIEGAGSPSEINLKKNDIVNMNMAKYANADVYITSDIDRGGMFASFLGTFDTLDEWERKLVKGLIINRFRGDEKLLDPGIDYLNKFLNTPVIGCIPFIKNHRIPEEDCIEFKSGVLDDEKELGDRIDIAVIDTPRISNFSDLDALRIEPDVKVRIVRKASELGNPHLVLLCGSKSVMRDLEYLKESGIAQRILKLHLEKQVMVVGICGGYQMLGEKIKDPNKIESDIEFMEGLGLLPIETTLENEKLLGQTKAKFLPWGSPLTGYEIHHGKTKATNPNAKVVIKSNSGKEIGHSDLKGKVWGSYLHGIFDEDGFRREFINHLRMNCGKVPINENINSYNVDSSIDHLADVVRDHIDMDLIYKNLGI